MILPACTKDVRKGCWRRSPSLLCTPLRLTVIDVFYFILPFSADMIFRHIAAIVNRQWLKFACCFLPINKAIDPHCCHQFLTHMNRSQPTVIPHLLVCVAVSKSHLYKWTWCLTVAVVVVLHYLHLTNASTTFSPFIFKYCWHIWRFYVFLFLLSSFFMSYDNVMMCIFFLLIKLYSNQVCFCPFTLCGFPEGTWGRRI